MRDRIAIAGQRARSRVRSSARGVHRTTCMHSTIKLRASMLALAFLAGASSVAAMPAVQAPLPPFRSADITGQAHHSSELRGRPTFLAVLTSSEAGDGARTWTQEARRRFRGTNVKFVTVVSLDLSLFVPTSMVRSAARDQTPRDEWHRTWIDRNGSARRSLGLPRGDHQPYFFALDAQGKVRAWAHGPYEARAAERVFSHLARTQ